MPVQHVSRRWLVLALWSSLLIAAAGAGMWACSIGVGLLVGGVATAALLLFVVDPDGSSTTDKRTGAT